MKSCLFVGLVLFTSALGSSAMAAGCVKGAIVGGVIGHMAGHHGVAGAAAGCAIGHHEANKPTNGQSRNDQSGNNNRS